MEMHGIPHIKLNNIKTKSYMICWHILGVEGTERFCLPQK